MAPLKSHHLAHQHRLHQFDQAGWVGDDGDKVDWNDARRRRTRMMRRVRTSRDEALKTKKKMKAEPRDDCQCGQGDDDAGDDNTSSHLQSKLKTPVPDLLMRTTTV
jgi:hypothetical protein